MRENTVKVHVRTLADVEADCRRLGAELKLDIEFRQSNREYEIIDWIHAARGRAAGIVINPAAFTHTSVAILDALIAFEGPIIEVHISNVHQREEFRRHSYLSAVASGVIVGCGAQGKGEKKKRVMRLSPPPLWGRVRVGGRAEPNSSNPRPAA